MNTPEWLRSKELDETGREKISKWKVVLVILGGLAVVSFLVFLISDMGKGKEIEKPIEKISKKMQEPNITFDDEEEEHVYTPTTSYNGDTDKKDTTDHKEDKEEEKDPRIEILARLGKERFDSFKMDHDKVAKFQEVSAMNGTNGGCDILPGTTAKLGLNRVVNTDGGGVATATLMEPIPGPNGCIAVDGGATFTGMVDTKVEFGQSTANIVFTSITTTDSNVIEIEGQAGDAVGGGGVPGDVNRHWGSKLTGVAVSTAVDLAGFALGSSSGSGYNIMLGNAGDVLDDFARQFVNRKDTIIVDPTKGQQIITVTFTKKVKI